MTVPPAAKAPMMPITSPRISGVRATNDGAVADQREHARAGTSRRSRARPEISGMRNSTVSAMTR